MKTYMFNGECWYIDDRPIWARIRRWIVSIGLREMRNGRLSNEGPITPLSFLGHRLTIHGYWFNAKTPWGWLVVRFERHPVTNKVLPSIESVYISHNGTPGGAHVWLKGAPNELVKHLETRAAA